MHVTCWVMLGDGCYYYAMVGVFILKITGSRSSSTLSYRGDLWVSVFLHYFRRSTYLGASQSKVWKLNVNRAFMIIMMMARMTLYKSRPHRSVRFSSSFYHHHTHRVRIIGKGANFILLQFSCQSHLETIGTIMCVFTLKVASSSLLFFIHHSPFQ